MILLRWIVSMFTFAQQGGGRGGGSGPPPIPDGPGGGGGDGSGGGGDRPDNSIIGGYAYRPRPPLVGGFGAYRPGPTSSIPDPYRTNDLHRILTMLNNQGAILDLQEALLAAGLLTGSVQFGVIDSATEDAFETLLTIANQNGLEWRDVLSQGAQSGAFASVDTADLGGGRVDPSFITLPNPEDLDRSIEDVGMTMTGERLDDDLRAVISESLMDSFRTQQERQLQTELTRTGSGPFIEHDPPDANRLLEEEIEERAPQKVMNKQTRDAMEVWFEMIGEPL